MAMESCKAQLHAEWEPQKLTHDWERQRHLEKLFQKTFSSALTGSPSKQERSSSRSLRTFKNGYKAQEPSK